MIYNKTGLLPVQGTPLYLHKHTFLGLSFDNAMAENFFSILKAECVKKYKIEDFDTAKRIIDEYIHFYNHERIQLKTKQTPLEKRRLLA